MSIFKLEIAAAAPKEQFEMFREKSVVGKVHNFVPPVLRSHKRRKMFTTAQRRLKEDDPIWSFRTLNLVRDGGVRWTSTYLMLWRCFELKDPINRFQRQVHASLHLDDLEDLKEEMAGTEEDDEDEDGNQPIRNSATRIPYDPLIDTITDDEWAEVERLSDFLAHFYAGTRRLEGNQRKSGFGSLWQTITNLQHLDDVL